MVVVTARRSGLANLDGKFSKFLADKCSVLIWRVAFRGVGGTAQAGECSSVVHSSIRLVIGHGSAGR